MDKTTKKKMLKKYAREQKNALLESLPFDAAQFKQLFDYLDGMLKKDGCDNTLRHTTEFLSVHGLTVDKSLDWMRANGGYCDCEVLENI